MTMQSHSRCGRKYKAGWHLFLKGPERDIWPKRAAQWKVNFEQKRGGQLWAIASVEDFLKSHGTHVVEVVVAVRKTHSNAAQSWWESLIERRICDSHLCQWRSANILQIYKSTCQTSTVEWVLRNVNTTSLSEENEMKLNPFSMSFVV